MANALIGYSNLCDDATLSGGSWLTTLPLTNLQDRTIGVVARSSDATTVSTQFNANIGTDKSVRVLAFVGHNLSLDAQYRITGSSDSGFASLDYQSSWADVWPAIFQTLQLEWESTNWWSGRPLASDLVGYTWALIHVLSTGLTLQYWRVELSDIDNTDGYVEGGRFFIGPAWQTAVNIVMGWSIGWETDTVVQKALSSSEYFSHRTPYRVTKFSTPAMDEDEAYGQAFEIQRRVAVDGEVMFMLDPNDTLHKTRRQFLGRLRSLSAIENPSPALFGTTWEVKELI